MSTFSLLLVALLQVTHVAASVPPTVSTVKEFNELMRSGKIFDAQNTFSAMPDSQVNALYHDFLKTVGSVGNDGEVLHALDKADYDERFDAFKASIGNILRLTEEATRDGQEVYFGITSNADWSKDRWSKRTNMHLQKDRAPMQTVDVPETKRDMFSNATHKEAGKGAGTCGENKINDVRNQGSCGSCWAFSTSEQVRYDYQRLYGKDPGPLSAQFLIDCGSPADQLYACDGGNTHSAISLMIKKGGIPTAADYGPSTERKGRCKNVRKTVIPGPGFDTSKEPEMYKYYCDIGPFTVSICADHANAAVMHYAGGVMTPERCCTKTDHRVVVVGMYKYRGIWAWVVQNSWGPSWGATEQGVPASGRNGGFILMKYNADTCHLAEQATFLPRVFSVGGPHPWTHTAPLLEWKKYWGPYSGVHYTSHTAAIHSSSQATFARCAAHTEALGDTSFIYAAASKACYSTSGGYGLSSGSGASATAYKIGDKPAAHLPPAPPSPQHPPAPTPAPRPPPGRKPTLRHSWNVVKTTHRGFFTTPHSAVSVKSALECALFAESLGDETAFFLYTPQTGACQAATTLRVSYSYYTSGAVTYLYQVSSTQSQLSIEGEQVEPSHRPMVIAAFAVSALVGSMAVFLTRHLKPSSSSSPSEGYIQIEQ